MTGRRRLNGEGSFYKTKSGYRAYVWVSLPDGRRRRKYVYGQTREEVQAKWTALQERARRGPVVTKSPTVESYMADWLENVVRPGLAPSTTQAYDMCLRLYIRPHLGTRRLDRLTVSDVQGWVNRLRRTCQCCSQGKDAARADTGVLCNRQVLRPAAERLDGSSGLARAACSAECSPT